MVVERPGGPEALQVVERPDPVPGPGEVLVRVGAAGVNRADLLQRRGLYPPPPGASDVLGLELAGTIAGLGADVPGWSVGDRVMAVVAGGAYAELATVDARGLLRVPQGMDDATAAAFPEVFTTVWDNVVRRGRLQAGEVLLVHGATSGIGTAAAQVARLLGAGLVVTARTPEKLAAAAALAPHDRGVAYRDEDFVAAARQHTAGQGVDVILDVVGGSYLQRNLEALAIDGRLVVIGLQAGSRADLDLGLMLRRRLQVSGSTLRSRSAEEKGKLAREVDSQLLPALIEGRIHPVLDAAFPLEQAAKAHARMEAGDHVGKIVLQTGSA